MKLISSALLLIITYQYTKSLEIVEKSNIPKELDRFEPNRESLDSRKLPKW